MVTVTAPSAPHRLDAEAYGRIVSSGALEGTRVELLDGLVVDMTPASPLHAELVTRLTAHLVPAEATLRVQMGLQAAPDSVPEPDLALVEPGDYSTAHPTSALLVVEVAVSSQELDRGRKAELYAAAGVPAYWLVDASGRTVEVMGQPRAGRYCRREVFAIGARVPSPATGVAPLEVAALFERS